jgi:hypothetical protein
MEAPNKKREEIMNRSDEPERDSHETAPGEGSEADIAEQSRPWIEGEEADKPVVPPDAPEADVLEQSMPVEADEEDRGH